MVKGATKPCFELRIGLVMYGGTALAVYMNGVILELLAFIRASQQPELGGPYAEVLKQARAEVQIDVISGTSAGGLNALVLAQALATGTSAEGLKHLWITAAQLENLLRTSDPHAVLSGEVMERNLGKIFDQMSREHAESEQARALAAKVPVLDLFLTATDIRGRTWTATDPVFDQEITGVCNRHLFHLKKRTENTSGTDETKRGYKRNDFYSEEYDQQARNELLMLMGRATSAFPGALPPVKITQTACKTAGLAHLLANYDRETVWFSDGGILMNKPFAPVIKTIFERSADKPVQRVVLYVEPDPADRAAIAAPDEPHFMEIVAAPFVLPFNEDISGYRDEVDRHNEHRQQLRDTFVQFESAAEVNLDPGNGPAVTAYRNLRKEQTRKAVQAALLCSFASKQSDAQSIVERLMAAINPAGSDAILAFDVDYQSRRLHYLLLMVDEFAANVGPDARATLDQAQPHLWNALEDWNNGRWIMANAMDTKLQSPETAENHIRGELQAACTALAADPTSQDKAGDVVKLLKNVLARAKHKADVAEQKVKGLAPRESKTDVAGAKAVPLSSLSPIERIVNASVYFEARDVVLFPLVAHGDLAEWDEIRIGQLTPGATEGLRRRGRDKLASDILGHFGGFLSEKWRRNDIMWGRLDTADQLLTLLKREAKPHVDNMAALEQAVAECRAARQRQILIDECECLDAVKLQKRCAPAVARRRAVAVSQAEPAVTAMPEELQRELALMPAERHAAFQKEWDDQQNVIATAEKQWYQQVLERSRMETAQHGQPGGHRETQRDHARQMVDREAAFSQMSPALAQPALWAPAEGPPDLKAIIARADIEDLREYLTLDHSIGEEGLDAVSRVTRVTAILGALNNLILALNRPGSAMTGGAHWAQGAADGILKPIHFFTRLLLGPGAPWWVQVRSTILLGMPFAGCLLLLLHGLGWIHLQGPGAILAGVLLLPLALLILIDRWFLRVGFALLGVGVAAGTVWAIERAMPGALRQNPLTAIPTDARWALLGVFGLITALSTVLMGALGSLPWIRGVAKGIVSLELAGSRAKASEITDSWRSSDTHFSERLGFNLGIDFCFILGYAPLLGLAAIMAGEALPAAWAVAKPLGIVLAWGLLLAGLLDMVKNVALMRTVLRQQGEWAPRIARWSASVKFALLITGGTFIGLTLIYLAVAARMLPRVNI